jgi:UDP:flavonoid glycosyltransferase YjiC (YdhE family)
LSRIVFTTWGSLGDLHPYIALGLELQRRGHDVAVATLPAWQPNVERSGLEFQPLRPDVPPQDESREIVRRILDARGGPGYLFKEVLGPALRDTYDDTVEALRAADLAVSHQIPVTTPIVAEQTGMKWVSGVLMPMGFLSAHDPPTPPQAPALRTIAGLHPMLGRAMNALGRRVAAPWAEPIYRFRESLGMDRGANPLFEGQHSPHLVLALFSRVLAEKQPDYPPQAVVTGFPFYDGGDRQPDPELLAFLADGEPPIVFTLGSSAVYLADDFYDVSIEAVQRLRRRALLLAGENTAALRPRLPSSIAAVDYAPHSLVMSRGCLTVHQGGVGTTGQALRAGKPMIVVPFGQDQPDNARRCVEAGVARTIARRGYTADRLTNELRALLDDPSYAQRAREVAAVVEAEHGTLAACDHIEQVLGR